MTTPVLPSVQPLITAVRGAIAARGVLVGDGRKPDGVTNRPYVVAWWDAGRLTNRSLRSRDGLQVVCTFHSVGLSPEAARIAVKAVWASVLGMHQAEVGGWVSQMPTHSPALPMTRDDDANPVIWTQADEWTFRLSPA